MCYLLFPGLLIEQKTIFEVFKYLDLSLKVKLIRLFVKIKRINNNEQMSNSSNQVRMYVIIWFAMW